MSNVTTVRIDSEIKRLQKEIAAARKVVAAFIQEDQVLGSVRPSSEGLREKYNMNGMG